MINRLAIIAIAILTASCASKKLTNGTVTYKTPNGKAIIIADSKPASQQKIKKFSDLIPADVKADNGLFNTYYVAGRYYFEIPDSLLKRDMMVVTRFVRTPPGLNVVFEQHGGEIENKQIWRWERHNQQIFIKVPNYSVMASEKSDLNRAVYNSTLETIMAAFDIKAYNKDTTGVMIDVTDFYKGNTPEIGISNALKRSYKVSGLDDARSYTDTIKSFPLNIEVREVKTYSAAESPIDKTSTAITFELNTSMVLMPAVTMKPRIMDQRVHYISEERTDYESDKQKTETVNYIERWKLEPKDEAAYERGELVEPKKPIVFYIDPATPKKWVPYFIKAVNDWQVAFEAAGFKNAIIGREAPTPQEDPEFSIEDARYNVILYLASDIENAFGPHIIDPRSGEVLESHVEFFNNHLKLLRDWYMIQTGAANPLARVPQLTDDQMGNMISFVVSHEIGHTLGLPHNVAASYAYPVDSLRSKTFTDKHGTAASIMDYARFNYIAQPGDGITQFSPRIGEYDLWSIKWGYSWFPKDKTPEQEKVVLDKWTKEKAGNPLYTFEEEQTNVDPRGQYEDLGNDAMKASAYGIANLKRIVPNLEKWTYQEGQDYSDLQYMYGQLVNDQFARYIGHVRMNVGGMNLYYKTDDEKGALINYVKKDKQHEAMLFLNKELFTTPTWLIDKEELSKFDKGVIIADIKDVQTTCVDRLLMPSRFARMYNNYLLNGNAAYSVTDFFNDLRSGIFSAATPDDFKRNLQSFYVGAMIRLLEEDFKTDPSKSEIKLADEGSIPINVPASDIRPMVRAELKNIADKLPKGDDAINKAHYNYLHYLIAQALNQTRVKIDNPVK